MMKQKMDRRNLTTAGLTGPSSPMDSLNCLDSAPVASSKHCSQAKPMRIEMAKMTCLMPASTQGGVYSSGRSAILSRTHIAQYEAMEQEMARITWRSIWSSLRDGKPAMAHLDPKNMHQAKA